VEDITERKRAEEATHELSGKLINAQEEERARVAKELHDDLSQNLALLAVELEMFSQRLPENRAEINARLLDLFEQVKGLSGDVHRLSHGLHPAKLERLGLSAAIGGFCREVELGGVVEVQFSAVDIPRVLPRELALCLYRVAQEALQNVIKHSGASSATVQLKKAGNEIQMTIGDDGKGFDCAIEPGPESLGMVGMRERVRLVNGEIEWDSTPGKGTTVSVRAPLSREMAK
jgi:signal transduction histidine kinase